MNYVAPERSLNAFTCPYCNTLAQQDRDVMFVIKSSSGKYFYRETTDGSSTEELFHITTCRSCGKYHLWLNDKMIQPNSTNIPLPNPDMPEEVAKIYDEAKEVFMSSPRASAALLRLALQHLCVNLGGGGKNINDDIASFVKGGLDVRVQQSLDIVRVTGNNAVHPGQLDLIDNTEIAARLFSLLNFIVDAMITQPKQIEAFFNELPQGAREAIEKRDA